MSSPPRGCSRAHLRLFLVLALMSKIVFDPLAWKESEELAVAGGGHGCASGSATTDFSKLTDCKHGTFAIKSTDTGFTITPDAAAKASGAPPPTGMEAAAAVCQSAAVAKVNATTAMKSYVVYLQRNKMIGDSAENRDRFLATMKEYSSTYAAAAAKDPNLQKVLDASKRIVTEAEMLFKGVSVGRLKLLM